MRHLTAVLVGLTLGIAPTAGAGHTAHARAPLADDAAKLLKEYAALDLAPRKGKADDAWRTRLDLEARIIRAGKAAPLREALGHPKRDVRAFAATALGVLGDRKAGPALIKLATTDGEAMVRGMALQSLGWLRTGKATVDAVEAAKSDSNRDVAFMAGVAAAHLKEGRVDHGGEVRKAYADALTLDEIGSAKQGETAPGFTLRDPDGARVQLKKLRGKRIVVLTFQLADW